jgi:hypothetical protein
VPTDDSLGIALARSFSRRKEFGRARKQLRHIAKRTPSRAEEIGELIAQVDKEQRWDEEPPADRERSLRGTHDLVGTRRRWGARIAVGSDVRQPTGALLGLGFYQMRGVARATALAIRLEWTTRDDEMESVNAIALSVGLTRRVASARTFEVAAGIAPRFELRYDYHSGDSAWNRAGVGGDVTVELLPRALPATVGVRFNQSLTDSAHSSALLVELAFEVR